MQHLYRALDAFLAHELPREVRVSNAEGYAYYDLYPEAYFAAIDTLTRSLPGFTRAGVIGLRSIGTSLSGMACAALASRGIDVESWTVRPRGHPLSRELRIHDMMRDAWVAHAPDAWFIVDEGPGLSGSSIAAAANTLAAVGISPDRIVLVPHHLPDPSRFSPEIAAVWRRHRVVPALPDAAFVRESQLCERFAATSVIEISGGAWRSHLCGPGEPPTVNPAHERRKWLVSSKRRDLFVKSVGLGDYGQRAVERACEAMAAGFGPEVVDEGNGLLAWRRIPGTPSGRGDRVSDAMVARMATYLSWITTRPRHRDAEPVDVASVLQMARYNIQQSIDERAADRFSSSVDRNLALLTDQPPMRLDGRMFPHEWVITPATAIKCDGIDHDEDHFFPGPLDRAWDVAATLMEFCLDSGQRRAFVDAVAARTRDMHLHRRLALYIPIYLAYRVGYTAMSAQTLAGSPDGLGMAEGHRRYLRRLREALSVLPSL